MQKIGPVLRAARVLARLNTHELAVMAGVSEPTISSWEQGVRTPRPDNLTRLKTVLDTRGVFLLVDEALPIRGRVSGAVLKPHRDSGRSGTG